MSTLNQKPLLVNLVLNNKRAMRRYALALGLTLGSIKFAATVLIAGVFIVDWSLFSSKEAIFGAILAVLLLLLFELITHAIGLLIASEVVYSIVKTAHKKEDD